MVLHKGKFGLWSLLVSVLMGLFVMSEAAHAQSALDGFDPDANGSVFAQEAQADGKILIGGDFNFVGGTTRNYLARLNTDGTVDTAFNPNPNNTVLCFAAQSDGKILIGGHFTLVDGTARNRIARLNVDGTLDTTFNPDADNTVMAIMIQSNGKILIGGQFTTVGGTTRNSIARLNADGTVDATFNPLIYNEVLAFAIQTDGKILIGGLFSEVNGTTRNSIVRLNADGTLDTSFNPNAIGTSYNLVSTLAVQADGKILMGGAFDTVGGTTRNNIARLNADGTVDTTFNPNANGDLSSIAIQADGKILIAGFFTSVGGTARNYIARLNANGTLDTSFNPNANNFVYELAVQSDGKIIVGGYFSSVGGITRNYIARLYVNGSVETTFNPSANSNVLCLAVQADGKILVVGSFTTLGGQTRNYIGRLNVDGTLDTTFNPNANNTVYTIAVQSDGKILIGGYFTNVGGTARNRIARLNTDGTVDTGFNPTANGAVLALAVQSDGKIVIGGQFTSVGGTARNYIARLNANGALDMAFNPNANQEVGSLAVQSDGKILIGGAFTSVGGTTRNYIARLNANGALDTAFNPNANNFVYNFAEQSDGKILIVGQFSYVGVTLRRNIARLNADGTVDATFNPNVSSGILALAVQVDGKILIGGRFNGAMSVGGTTRNRIARLNMDGTVDTAFDPNANDEVYALRVQSDGKILMGGIFTILGGSATRNRVARLTNTDAALQNLTTNSTGTSVSWNRSQASPEVWRTTFEESGDGATWTSLGDGTRVTGGWTLTGLTLTQGQNRYIRARGYAANRSTSVHESVKMYYIPIPDQVPDQFTLTDQTNVALSTLVTSNTITVSGINATATISITGLGEYAINDGAYTSAAGTVNNGDTVTVHQTSSAWPGNTTNIDLTIGGVSDTFSVTTLAPDDTPDQFTFVDQTGVSLSTLATSNTITVSGINLSANVSISWGEYSINDGEYTYGTSIVWNGDTITVRQTSSSSYSTTTDITLTIFGVSSVSDTFSVTTQAAPTAVTLVSFEGEVSSDGTVTLTWETASELNNAGFNIYRSRSKDGHYTKINDTLIPAQGDTTSGASYRYEDTPPSKGTYFYKLEDVDFNGVSAMHGPEKVRVKK